MLQQILKDMYIDPDVLNALNEDQKKTLFLKMRQEQVRRWKEREEKLEEEEDANANANAERKRTRPKKANSKNVSWLLGRDGDVSVLVIGDVDELGSKFICSGFGNDKAESRQSNSYLQTVLKSRKGTDAAVRSERENLLVKTQAGISVSLKEKQEASDSSLPLSVSVSERSSSASAAQQRELKSSLSAEEKPASQLSICSRVDPVVVRPANAAPGSVSTRPGLLTEIRQTSTTTTANTTTANAAAAANTATPLSAHTRTNLCSKEPPQSHESQDLAASEARSRRAASEDGGGSAAASSAGGRGRVAQLMKTFSVDTQSQTRAVKPALPNKPNHLRGGASSIR